MYNIGVIGCGYMGKAHLENIPKKYARPYAVCDINKNLADATAKEYGTKVFYDAQRLIEDEDVQIVIIATYPASHIQLLEMCLKNKKHVLCEKPIAQNIEDADKFREIVEKYPQSKVAVGYILRHNETFIKIKEMIDNNALGRPLVIRLTHNQSDGTRASALFNILNEVSPIVDCGVHYIDLMRWLTGEEITEIDGFGTKNNPDLPEKTYNYGMLNVKLSGGSVGFYETGWGKSFVNSNVKEFIGPKGKLSLTYQSERGLMSYKGNLITYYDTEKRKVKKINIPFKNKPTGRQLEYLFRMIEENISANPTVNDVILSFEAACKADKKIREKLN